MIQMLKFGQNFNGCERSEILCAVHLVPAQGPHIKPDNTGDDMLLDRMFDVLNKAPVR